MYTLSSERVPGLVPAVPAVPDEDVVSAYICQRWVVDSKKAQTF